MQAHCLKSSHCSFVKNYQVKKRARLVEKTRQKQKRTRVEKKQQTRIVEETRNVEKTRIEKKRLKVFVCKRYFVKFFNNIKLYQYIHDYYQKFATKLAKSMFASSSNELVLFASKLATIQTFFTSSITSSIEIFNFVDRILFATSKTQIF